MSPRLILGPLLRHVCTSDATVWVETHTPCEVEVRAGDSPHRSPTFTVEGHYYALVVITGLEPGSTYEYEVRLDGERVWPDMESSLPPSVIRTIGPDGGLTLAFGSCRVSVPHEPPYTKKRGVVKRGGVSGQRYARDALYALALRMRRRPSEEWPDALLLLGDQIYDDDDVHDDWNTSETWVRQMRSKPWWEERIVGAFMSYWVYQHLGNLSPRELEEDDLFGRVREAGDATRMLREFAYKADRETVGTRWSFHRDFGVVRLIMMDSRAGRVLGEGKRSMLDVEEWAWIEDTATGDFDHLLFGTSLPFLLSPGLHHLEAWNEAVCGGAWGRPAAKLGEYIRQLLDLEHWSAFYASFARLAKLLRAVGAGERSNSPPASITVLSGDVHHGYLAEMDLGVRSAVYQAVCSPLRNPLGVPERLALGAGWTKRGERFGKALARLAGVEEPPVRWSLTHEEPWFENHVGTLEMRGREATLRVEKTDPEDEVEPRLYTILEQ